ncbi:MAG: hypothetical protein CBC13_05885 [Planctomycetia bacterium TMED53]|nr:MAG: hypothetical protein CBC13_05885 [Planctomycetia bacterium TMED53]
MQEILDRAAVGLDLVSICDHDTLGAYRSEWTLPENLRLLPGIEMTCQVGELDLHMLAYFPAGLSEEIHDWAKELESDRRQRVLKGVEQLREMGIPLLWRDLEAEVGDSVPCRSHVARALVRGRLCSTTAQAFRQWLGRIKFQRPALTAIQGFSEVHSLGGLTYWAHPRAAHIEEHGAYLLAAGLDGVEVLYKNLKSPNRRTAREFQEQHRLGICGGSDLHQENSKFVLGRFGVDLSRLDPRLVNPVGEIAYSTSASK